MAIDTGILSMNSQNILKNTRNKVYVGKNKMKTVDTKNKETLII